MYPSRLNEKLVNAATECISAYDKKLFITLWNKACESKFGISAEEAVGRHLLHLFPHIINDYRVQCLQMAADAGKTYYFPNMAYMYAEHFLLYSQYICPLRENGEITGVVNIVRDHPEEEMYTIDDFRKFFQ